MKDWIWINDILSVKREQKGFKCRRLNMDTAKYSYFYIYNFEIKRIIKMLEERVR